MRPPGDACRSGGAAAAARHARLRRERLAVDAPDARVGAAVDRANRRLDGYRADPATAGFGAEDAVAATLGALACGAFDVARRALPRLVLGADAAAFLALVTRYLAWTGDAGLVRAHRVAVRRACATAAVVPAGLAAVAESIGDRDLAAELRRRTPALVAIDGRSEPPAPAARADDPAAPEPAGAEPWVSLDADAAFRQWWRRVERTSAQTAPAAEAEVDDAAAARAAAEVVLPLVHGLLGVEPDATRGRLRLRPRIPADWDRLDVLRLRLGDAAVALHYAREGCRHTFRAEQRSGGIPIRLILEPALPGRCLLTARVDGAQAALDPRPAGGRVLVPVQLLLDHERTLEFHVQDDDAPDDTA